MPAVDLSPYQATGPTGEEPSSRGFFVRLALQGALPLFLGVAIYAGWMVTRAAWLPWAGFLVIAGGLVVFAGGAAEIIGRKKQQAASSASGSWRMAGIAWAALFLLNAGVACAIVARVVTQETAYSVVIVNASSTPLTDMTLTGPGVKRSLHDLPPGRQVQTKLHFSDDGALVLSGKRLGEPFTVTVSNYVTHSLPGHAIVEFDAGGQITQRESHDPIMFAQ